LITLTSMETGSVVVDHASRRFRVYPQRRITLKEAIVQRRSLKPTEIWALRDVSFEITPGEAVAFVGRNGSGKTTLLRLIAGIFRPTEGTVAVSGSVGSLLELGAGFHPDFTGRENIFLNGSIYGLKRNLIREKLDEIIEFSELERFIDLPVRTYSSGMHMRLGFAVAVHLNADIVLLDEVFAVGDEAFQRKCVARILEFKQRGGTIVFVSHSASAVERLCERAVLLNNGHVEFDGESHEALRRYSGLLEETTPAAEREAPSRQWGSGELRVVRARLEGADGEERREFLPDEPVTLQIHLSCDQPVPSPSFVVELCGQDGSLLGSSERTAAELGWEPTAGEWRLRFELDRMPVIDGRFQFGVSIWDASGEHLYHRLERAAEFLVNPVGRVRGSFRFDGRWLVEDVPVEVR
jgi:ABC-type polysaccharide/polyol phosphate transport system ATPase subunit